MNISEFLEKSDSVKTSPGQLRNLEFVVGAKLSPQYESYLSNYNGVMPSRRCAISKDRKIETTVHGVYILKESDSTDGLLTAIKSRPIVIQRGYIPIMYDDLGGDFLLNLHNGAIEYYDYGNDDSGIFGESLYDFLKNLREPLEQVDISYLIQHQLIDELSVALDKLEDPNAGVDEVGNSAVCIQFLKMYQLFTNS